MSHSLRVLLIEDSEDDADLLLRELRRGGYEPTWERVDTAPALLAALTRQKWDLITCDWVMLRFDALSALQLIHEQGVDLPIVVVSGEVGEEVAVTAMRAGAHDFVSKHNLTRLCPAIERELRDADVRRARQRAEHALIERSRMLDAVFDHSVSCLVLLDRRFNFIRVNQAYARACRRAANEFAGRNHFDLYPSDAQAIFENVVETKQPFQVLARPFSFPEQPERGVTFWDWTLVPLFDERGDVEFLLLSLHDVTEHVQTAEALRESEERFANAFEYAAIGMALVAPEGRWLVVNQALCELVGYPAEELLTKTFQDITHPNDLETDLAYVRQVLAAEIRSYRLEKRYFHKLGYTVWVLLSVSLVRDAHGQPLYFISQIQDITDRKRAEETLREREEQLRLITENMLDLVSRVSLDETYEYVSPAHQRVLGYPPEQMLGKSILSFLHPDDTALARAAIAASLGAGTGRVNIRYRHADGHYLWLETTGRLLYDARGTAIGAVLSSHDITERKHADEALRRSEQRFRSLTEKSLDLVAILNRDGTYRYVNPAHETAYGIKPEELVGTKAFDFLHPDDVRDLGPMLAEAIRTGMPAATVEYRIRHKDGSWHAIEGIALNLFDDPEVAGLLITGRDVSARKRAEEKTSVLLQIAKDVTGTLDLNEVLDRVQRRTVQVLRCDVVMTFSWDKAQGVSRMLSHYGIPANLLPAVEALRFPAGRLFGGRLTNGETVVVNDLHRATGTLAEFFRDFGVAAMVAAPLLVPGGRVGTIIALRTRPDRPFETDQVDLCTGIAGHLARTIEAVELHQAQQRETAVSQALARVGRELIGALETPMLLDRLCQVAAEVLECDASHTLLWQPEEAVFTPMAGYGATPEEREVARMIKVPRALMSDVLSRLETDDVAQVGTIPPELLSRPAQQRLGVTLTLCMALRRGTELIGLQIALSRNRRESFTETQRRIARGIAQVASLALEHARVVTELERANRVKSEFVATMSHELRTPLSVITGYTDLMLEGNFGTLTAEQTDNLRRVQRSAHELLELITATLDLSRLETGRMSVEVTDVQLADVIQQLDDETPDLQERSGLRFVWHVAPDLPPVRTDPVKLKLVLRNLLGNAVKFTEHGTVTVDVHAADGGVEITVADTGIGITPEALEIIFEPFRQGDSSTTRRFEGVGLGLYIVHRLLDLLAGTISVESEVGRGSTFRVWLPRNMLPSSSPPS